MNLDDDEVIKDPAQLERDMDSGKQPYVVHKGERVAVIKQVMEEMGLVSGQNVSGYLIQVMQQKSSAHIEAEMAIDKASHS